MSKRRSAVPSVTRVLEDIAGTSEATAPDQPGGQRVFRHVQLPQHVRGSLLLHSMPGRLEPLEVAWGQVRADGVQAIVNLARPDEIWEKSPDYAKALQSGHLPCPVISFPVKDYGTPRCREAFWQLTVDLARRLEAGERILVHCAAGIGRTGTLATCLLIALGETQAAAAKAVRTAGSSPETDGQMGIAAWCVERRQQHQPPRHDQGGPDQ